MLSRWHESIFQNSRAKIYNSLKGALKKGDEAEKENKLSVNSH